MRIVERTFRLYSISSMLKSRRLVVSILLRVASMLIL